MKNIIIWTPPRGTGYTWLSKKIKTELGFKGSIVAALEIWGGEEFEIEEQKCKGEKFAIDNTLVFCMGYPNISPEEMVKRDPKLPIEEVRKSYELSKRMEKDAKRLGIKFFDVSERKEGFIDKILEYVKNNI